MIYEEVEKNGDTAKTMFWVGLPTKLASEKDAKFRFVTFLQ